MAALATHSSAKWIDNVLSHNDLPGVERSRQGVERRITGEGLLAIELVRRLSRECGFTVSWAAAIVARALPARTDAGVVLLLGPGVELRVDTRAIEEGLRGRLADAIEAAPRIPRGRPRVKKKTPDV